MMTSPGRNRSNFLDALAIMFSVPPEVVRNKSFVVETRSGRGTGRA